MLNADLAQIEWLVKIISTGWLPIVISAVFILLSIKKDNMIAAKLEQMIWLLWKNFFNREDAVKFFKLILWRHITKKLDIIRDILEKNSIEKRANEIKARIRTEFDWITQDWIQELSKINSPVWDMWEVLAWVNFETFYNEVFDILFKKVEWEKYMVINTKERDLRFLMEWYVNSLVKILENK